MKCLAAIHESFGKPVEVLTAKEIEVGSPSSGQALVRLVRASVNPSDLGMIGGSYGRLRTLPAVAGREGVGEVVEVGPGVSSVSVGDMVRIPEEPGVWAQYHLCAADSLMRLPGGLDPDMLAMSFINPPTALCVLDSFADLREGDWVIQNGAGSALGLFMIQLCAARGVKTVNMLRNASAKEAALKAMGADVVVDEAAFDPKALKDLTGGAKPVLGLNQIGGASVSNMIRAVGDSATIVTVGGMVGDPVRFPTRFLIFNDLRLRGFWWDKWQRTHSEAEVAALFEKIFALVGRGVLKAPVDSVFPISEVKSAMLRASEGGRSGKVMLGF